MVTVSPLHAYPRVPDAGLREIAASVAVWFIGSLKVRVNGWNRSTVCAPSRGVEAMTTGGVASIANGGLVAWPSRPPESRAVTRILAACVSTAGIVTKTERGVPGGRGVPPTSEVQDVPPSVDRLTHVITEAPSSVIWKRRVCDDPPDQSSPPEGLVSCTTGAQAVRNGHAYGDAITLPGSEASRALVRTVAVYSAQVVRGSCCTVSVSSGRLVVDHAYTK